MARNRRDPRREKTLDMRRLDGGRLSDIFYKCHPEHHWRNTPEGLTWEERRLLWRESDLAEEEWVRAATGGRGHHRRFCYGSPPAWFRRDRNRLIRAKDRHAMARQLRDGDDVGLPRRRRDIRWLWW